MKRPSAVAALVAAVLLLAACGVESRSTASGSDGGDLGSTSRPSASAIADSMQGSDLVSDLTDDERQCFAQAIHDGDLSTEIIDKVMAQDDLDDTELSTLDSALDSAASSCGFSYQSGG